MNTVRAAAVRVMPPATDEAEWGMTKSLKEVAA